MKAIVYKKYGSTDVLHVQEVKTTPKDDEILIKVHAAEVTKADCEMRSFNFAVKCFWLPLRLALGILRPRKPILAGYLSGEVETAGKDVSNFFPGDKILALKDLNSALMGNMYACPE
jgi:NADPH:quinone reductase-like Zn-dependent oxidoreductase